MFLSSVINTLLDAHITTVDILSENPFRFSSEYHDDALGLIYYNYRHYNPTSGRWLSRDPIEEVGGNNLYGMCKNNIFLYIDRLGLIISVGGRNVGTPTGVTGSNHTFIVIRTDDLECLQKCCPGLATSDLFMMISNGDGSYSSGFTMGAFDFGGTLTYQANEEKDLISVNESTHWYKPDWDFEENVVTIPEGKTENQVICDLLRAANNYNNAPVPYSWHNQNCTQWVLSIFKSMGINVDVDFGGIDWDGGKEIDPRLFHLPPPASPKTNLSPMHFPISLPIRERIIQ